MLMALAASCASRSSKDSVHVAEGSTVDMAGCHFRLDGANRNGSLKFISARYSCPSTLQEAGKWWGVGPEPLALTMREGDCLELNDQVYCVQSIEPGAAASLQRTFQKTCSACPLLRL